MRTFEDVEAAKIDLKFRSNYRKSLDKNRVRIDSPANPWHYAIIAESFRLERYAHNLKYEISNTVDKQIDIWDSSAGRVIEPSYPNQMSRGIIELAKIAGDAVPRLNRFKRNIEFYDDKASFGYDSDSDEMARNHLNAAREMVRRTRLSIYTHIWILWAMEGFNQVNEFGGLFESPHHFEGYPESTFTYIAYPPLAVTIFACSALIEEVGCKFLNKMTEKGNINEDSTSPRYILNELRSNLDDSGKFDLDKIDQEIVDRRNDLSHYISEREGMIRIDELEDFYSGIGETIGVTTHMINILDNDMYYKYMELVGSWIERKSSYPIENMQI